MYNHQLISNIIKPVTDFKDLSGVIDMLDNLNLEQIPVVNDEGIYLGLLDRSALYDLETEEGVDVVNLPLKKIAVPSEAHCFTAAKIQQQFSLDLVPVVNSENEYVGAITNDNLLTFFGNLTGINEQGALIVIEMKDVDYSISQLSRLVETNDAHITQLNTTNDPQTGLITITLRINKQDVSTIISTFQRYEYNVIYYMGEERYENELKSNFNNLMAFLEI